MNELGEEPPSGKYLYLTSSPASSVNYCGEEDYAKISKIFASTKFDIATGIQQHCKLFIIIPILIQSFDHFHCSNRVLCDLV